MNELALFAGAGGGILGGHLLGWKTVAAVEIEDYPREALLRRQLDGILSRFPIWDDVCTFDGKPWRGKIDVISGGFPCQDISAAGKGTGITGERSGLWTEMARIIGEVRPRFAFMENSPMLTSRGLGTVLGDLAEMGYDARWCVLGADDAGAPHRRKRIWILAYPGMFERGDGIGRSSGGNGTRKMDEKIRPSEAVKTTGSSATSEVMANSNGERLQGANVREAGQSAQGGLSPERRQIAWWDIDPADVPDPDQTGLQKAWSEQQAARAIDTGTGEEWPIKPKLGRVAHGVANRVDRLKAIGNGQVPAVAALAWEILTKDII